MEFLTKRPGVPTGRTKKQMLGGGGGGGGSKKISIKQALKKIVEKKELPNKYERQAGAWERALKREAPHKFKPKKKDKPESRKERDKRLAEHAQDVKKMKKHIEDKAEKDYMGQQRKYDIETKKKSEKIDWRKKGPEVGADIAKVMTAYLLAKKMKREKRK